MDLKVFLAISTFALLAYSEIVDTCLVFARPLIAYLALNTMAFTYLLLAFQTPSAIAAFIAQNRIA
jgi:hypothetical protein